MRQKSVYKRGETEEKMRLVFSDSVTVASIAPANLCVLLGILPLLVSKNTVLWFIILCWTFWCKFYCILSGILRNIWNFPQIFIAMCIAMLLFELPLQISLTFLTMMRLLSRFGLRPNNRQYYLIINFWSLCLIFNFAGVYPEIEDFRKAMAEKNHEIKSKLGSLSSLFI